MDLLRGPTVTMTVVAVVIITLSGAGVWHPCDVIDVLPAATGPTEVSDPQDDAVDMQALQTNLKQCFVENLGQLGEGAGLYYCIGEKMSVAFGTGWMAYDLHQGASGQGTLLRARFPGSNPVAPEGRDVLDYPTNFFYGDRETHWLNGARSYREVVYSGLWDGIDLGFRFDADHLKYGLVIRPGADPDMIGFRYEGAGSMGISDLTGELLISTVAGPLVDAAPTAFQEGPAGREGVECAFQLKGASTVAFAVGPHDADEDLTIDPGFEFGTLFGGLDNDGVFVAYEEGTGDIIASGFTFSDDLPVTPGAYCRTLTGHNSGFFARFNSNASKLLTCTYLFDMMSAGVASLRPGPDGNLWDVCQTRNKDFPVTEDAYCETMAGDSDCLLVEFDRNCTGVAYATFIGGSGDDYGREFAFDPTGNVYVVGGTFSPDFPTTEGAFCTSSSDFLGDIFVLELDIEGGRLIYSTIIGGEGMESCEGFAVDEEGHAHLSIGTGGTDFPTTPGAFSRSMSGTSDCVLLELDARGESLIYSTFLGGEESEDPTGFTLEEDGTVWIGGGTDSSDFPTTPGSFQPKDRGPGWDSFVAQLSSDGSDLIYGTYFSAAGATWIDSLALNGAGRPVAVGSINESSFEFPTTAPYPEPAGKHDAFVVWFDNRSAHLLNGTFLAGGSWDFPSAVTVGAGGLILVAGYTFSYNFPTSSGCYSNKLKGETDGFVVGLGLGITPWDLPTAPVGLNAIPLDESIWLRWSPPEYDGCWPIREYTVFGGEAPGCETLLGTVSRDTQFEVRGLENGKTYYLAVGAVTVVGEGPLSAPISCVPIGRPDVPLNFTATGGNGTVLLRWAPPTDDGGSPVLGYRLFRGPTFLELQPLVNLTDVKEHLDAGLDNGQTYFYKLCAFNALWNGSFSVVIGGTPRGPPGPPRYLTAEAFDGRVELEWRPPASDGGDQIVGYRLLRGGTGDALGPLSTVTDSIKFTDLTVTNGRTYFYVAIAFNAQGDGPRSEAVNATPKGPPGPPQDLTVEQYAGGLVLSWRAPLTDGGEPITSYEVYRSVDGGIPVHVAVLTDELTYHDTPVEIKKTYSYYVRATNKLGPGPSSDVVDAVFVGPPSMPSIGAQVDAGDAWIGIRWEAPGWTGGSAITAYRVYRGGSVSSISMLLEVGADATGFNDSGLVNGREYFYQVAALNKMHEGMRSDIVSGIPFTIPGPPRDLFAVRGNLSVTLNWSAPSDEGGRPIIGYLVLRGPTPGTMATMGRMTKDTQYTDSAVGRGVEYCYAVAAVNEAGEGSRSASVVVTVIGPPGPPHGLAAKADGDAIVLTWDEQSDNGSAPPTGYIVLRGTAAGDLVVIAETGLVQSYKDALVDRGTTYYYRLRAKSDLGDGELSDPVTFELEKKAGHHQPGFGLIGGVMAISAIWLIHRRSRKVHRWDRSERQA